MSTPKGLIEGRLARLLDSGKTDAEVLEELYLITLTRMPSIVERDRALAVILDAPSRREGFSDLLWALVNAREFLFSH